MGIDKFNSSIREIEAKHAGFFKERRIFSYYEADPVRRSEKYILSFFENRPLPKDIQEEIEAAYNTHLLVK